MNAHTNMPMMQMNLDQVVQEYEAKLNGGKVLRAGADPSDLHSVIAEYEGLDSLISRHKQLYSEIDLGCTMGAKYVGRVYDYHASLSRRRMEASLLESAWMHVYKGMSIDKIATASDRSKFELGLKNPPPFTKDNILATFGDYLMNTRQHLLRGVAEVFSNLDPSYKSHSKVKIGVEGLPKRIILSSVGGEFSYGSYGQGQLRDILNALASLTSHDHIHDGHVSEMARNALREGPQEWSLKKGERVTEDGKKEYDRITVGGTLKVYQNGNGHLSFNKEMQLIINRALAEYYGEVLPDTPDENVKRRASTAVSKDLQFYPTPDAVIRKIIDHSISMRDGGAGKKMLEPQCGDGRIMRAMRAEYPELSMSGVEVDPGRAMTCSNAGFKVLRANFLQVKPNPVYDYVFMNPPFYGTHWKKHLEHALKFLKPKEEGKRGSGGMLICILPGTAFYDGHLEDMGLIRKGAHKEKYGHRDTGWHDLPVGSFAESGTNVPTGYLVTGGERWT